MANNPIIILLIDANSLLYRCFHALPPLTARDGQPIQGVYGLAMMLMRIADEMRPGYVAAFFDRPEPTFRKEAYAEYKAHRPETPDDLIPQIDEAHRLFVAFGIPVIEQPGYEADDLIGTIAEQRKGNNGTIARILSSDNDFLQLVDDGRVVVEILRKGIRDTVLYTEALVEERFGVRPDQLADYKGLVGDASDNIPGVPGIGPKRATEILQRFGTLDEALARLGEDPALQKKLEPWREQALLSRSLATIDRNAPIAITLDALRFAPDYARIRRYFSELGLATLAKRVGEQQRLL
jgi:DNA polymerase-1